MKRKKIRMNTQNLHPESWLVAQPAKGSGRGPTVGVTSLKTAGHGTQMPVYTSRGGRN